MANYINLSIKKLFMNSKWTVTLMIIAQIFSVVVIVFSYGIVNHYSTKIDEPEGYELCYDFYRNSEYDTETEQLFLEKNLRKKKQIVKKVYIGWLRNGYDR